MFSLLKQELKRKKFSAVLILLISGIVVLSMGFLISNCGKKGPLAKAAGAGSYTLDFNKRVIADGNCGGLAFIATGRSIDFMSRSDFTIEAWVKPLQSTATTAPYSAGTIFSRAADRMGIVVSMTNTGNIGIMDDAHGVTHPGADHGPHYCSSTTRLTTTGGPYGGWWHVAAVKSQAIGPGDGHGTTATHTDIYVNGVRENSCYSPSWASMTEAFYRDSAGSLMNQWIGRAHSGGYGAGVSTGLHGSINEVRFWGQARTGTEILECMNTPLGVSGTCSAWGAGNTLWGYWRINEGNGTAIIDGSGRGKHGETRKCYGSTGGGADEVWFNGWLPQGSGRFDY